MVGDARLRARGRCDLPLPSEERGIAAAVPIVKAGYPLYPARSMLPPTFFFADHALSARLEAADAALLAELSLAIANHRPESHAVALSIAGGCAAFVGPIPPSRAAGLGMRGPVTTSELDALEDFYRSRGVPARILASPFADPSLFEQLGARGFRLVELDTMLVRRIEPGETLPSTTGDIAVRAARPEEGSAWVRASFEGMFESPAPPPADRLATFEAGFHAPGITYFFAEAGGVTTGTGATHIHEGAADFFATSTLPASRNCGVQAALIVARLAFAQAAGCDLCFSRTMAGSGSQRNLERCGFRPVYSRATMIKRFG